MLHSNNKAGTKIPFFLLAGKILSSIIYLLYSAFSGGLQNPLYLIDIIGLVIGGVLFITFILEFHLPKYLKIIFVYFLLLGSALSTSPVFMWDLVFIMIAAVFLDIKILELAPAFIFPIGRLVYDCFTAPSAFELLYTPELLILVWGLSFFIQKGKEQAKQTLMELEKKEARHEEEYSKIQEYVNIISEISASVLYLPVSELDWTINLTLETIGVYAGVNRCFIYEYEKNNSTYTTIYQWNKETGGENSTTMAVVTSEQIPWLDDRIQNGQIIMLGDISKIPDEGGAEKNEYIGRNIKSVLIIPLFHAKGILGCIGFESEDLREIWEDQTINLLNVVGQVTVTALERKKNANAFQVNDERFSELTENISQIFFLVNQDFSDVIYVSPPYEKIWEMKVADIYEDPSKWLEKVHPEDLEYIQSAIGDNVAREQAFTVEFRLGEGKRKHVKWILMRSFPVKDETGQVYRYAGLAEDITEKKQVEIKLAQARSQEVDIGAKIQQSLLLGYPNKEIEGLELCSMSLPSQEIDGDFFDFYFLNEKAVDFVIGDVMGKGIPAALMGAASKSGFLRAQLSLQTGPKNHPLVSDVVSRVDSYIAEELIKINKFVTLYYCRADMDKWQFHYVDCGHTSIIYYSALSGSCWFLKGSNMPLGFIKNQNYSEFHLPLYPGDILFFYSDGISEAVNGEGELFGEERLLKLVKSHAHLSAEELTELVKNRAFEYANGGFKDDVTSIGLKVTKEKRAGIEVELSKVFPREKDSIRGIRAFLLSICTMNLEGRFSEIEYQTILLGINEAVTNIVEHGGLGEAGEKGGDDDIIILQFLVYSGMVVFILNYKSREFDWKKKKKSDVMRYDTSGYGLSLIEEIMDSVIYYKGEDNQFRISMIKNISQEEEDSSGE